VSRNPEHPSSITILSYVSDGRLGLRPKLPGLIRRAVEEEGIDVISGQGNGMDGGPAYLGNGETPPPSETDLAPAILAARQARIPFVFSLGGRAGADAHVAPYLELLDQIAASDGAPIRTAFLRGEVDKEYVRSKLRDGIEMRRLVETPRLAERLTEREVDEAVRLQAQMGPEPLIEALRLYEAGEIDGVLAGRALDLAVHMAYPMLRGFPIAGSAHMAKVVECGGLVCDPPNPFGAVIATLSRDGSVLVSPADPEERCTVKSVASHALYERENPSLEENPGGALDIAQGSYEQVDHRTVRCAGATWIPRPYAVKVEGVKSLGHETVLFAFVREPELLCRLPEYIERQVARGRERVVASGLLGPDQFRVTVRATRPEPGAESAALLLRAVAPDPVSSFRVANTVRGELTHGNYDGRKTTAGNLAFPLSKAFIPMGEAYVFNVWHLLPLEDPLEPFAASTIEFPREAVREDVEVAV
jgi:hypothetical protein